MNYNPQINAILMEISIIHNQAGESDQSPSFCHMDMDATVL